MSASATATLDDDDYKSASGCRECVQNVITRMGNASEKLALLRLLLCAGAILAAPTTSTTTTKPSEEAQTDKPALAPESRSKSDAISEEDLDGRSAYINNRYVPDEDMEGDLEHSQPLYEILQKQMEHVLAATGPHMPSYGLESGDDNTSYEMKHDSLLRPPNRPSFEVQHAEEDVDDYPEDELHGEDIDDPETASQEESVETATQRTTTSTIKPKTTKRKHTIVIMRSTKAPHRAKTTTTTTAAETTTSTTTEKITAAATTTQKPTTTAARTTTTTTTTTERPSTSSSTSSSTTTTTTTSTVPPPTTTTTTTTTKKPNQLTLFPSNSIYPPNTDTYNHKRRIIFKTISTGSQFVQSPIGDLMIKFSIGFAKPPAAQLMSRSSTSVNEAIKALSGNLIKQINANALHKKHKRVKKSEGLEFH